MMAVQRKPCPCCGKFIGNKEFYDKLDAAEKALGKPLAVSSGYRCAAHNAKVSKKSTGRHVAGEAVDLIARTAADRGALLLALIGAGLKSFATLPGGAGLHVDAGTVPWLGIE